MGQRSVLVLKVKIGLPIRHEGLGVVLALVMRLSPQKHQNPTYLFLLLIEVVNYDPNEKIKCEEAAENDEDDEVQVHVHIVLPLGLQVHL